MITPTELAPFVRQRTILLTTYNRDGTPVVTPVNIAVDGDRAYVRTYDAAWKAKRLRHNPEVLIAPSTLRGVPTGPAVPGTARLLDGAEAERAARSLRRKHPVPHGIVVPLAHRVRRCRTPHYEVRVAGEPTT